MARDGKEKEDLSLTFGSDPASLRSDAARAWKLADAVKDQRIAERLEKLAHELEDRARLLEEDHT